MKQRVSVAPRSPSRRSVSTQTQAGQVSPLPFGIDMGETGGVTGRPVAVDFDASVVFSDRVRIVGLGPGERLLSPDGSAGRHSGDTPSYPGSPLGADPAAHAAGWVGALRVGWDRLNFADHPGCAGLGLIGRNRGAEGTRGLHMQALDGQGVPHIQYDTHHGGRTAHGQEGLQACAGLAA